MACQDKHSFLDSTSIGNVSEEKLAHYLSAFDNWEEYDENKVYSNEEFEYNGKRYRLDKLSCNYGDYITYCRVITKEYQQKLAPFCSCPICASSWYSPSRWFNHPYTVGCLWSDRTEDSYVKKAEPLYLASIADNQ